MRGSADFKLCNASGNTFSIFTYILYYRCVDNASLLTLLSFLSLEKASRARCCAPSLLNFRFEGNIQKAIEVRGLIRISVFRVFFSRNAFCAQNLHLACAFFFITCKDDDDAYEARRSAVVVEEEVEEWQLRLLASSSCCCCFPTRRRRGRSREKRRVVIEFSRISEMSIRPTRGVSEN